MSGTGRTSGWNDRYAPERFEGFDGDGGANEFPFETAIGLVAVDPNGTYDGVDTVPSGAISSVTKIVVTEVFNNTPTLILGRAGATNVLVALADAVDLTQLGTTYVTRAVTWGADAVLRATIGGTPNQGSATISVQFQY